MAARRTRTVRPYVALFAFQAPLSVRREAGRLAPPSPRQATFAR